MPSERALPPFSSSFRGGGAPPCAESACFLSPFREYAARSGRAEGLLGRGKKAERHAPLRTPVFCRSTGRQGIRHRQRTARKWDGYPAHGGGRTLGRPAGDDKGTAPGKGTCVRGGGGMPTEPDGTGPQLRRGEGGAIRTGVMSVRRIPVRRPLIAHGEEVCAGTSVQGGAVFSCSCVGPFLREGDSGVSGAVGHPWQVVLRWRGFPGRRRKRGVFCRRETGRGLRGRRGCAFSGKKPRLRPSGAELRGA